MRAVNLVPLEARPGRVSGGKSGGAVYGVLGAMVVLLLGLSLVALSKKKEAQSNQELAAIQQSTQAYTTAATQFSSFESAATQAASRINTVRGLAEARFDWAGAMREMSRLVPETSMVYNLSASVKDGAASGGASSQLRSAIAAPAITLTGCSKSQPEVANLVTRLQAMRRATNVALESSKQATAGGSAADCSFTNGYDFVLVVFFSPGKAKSSDEASPGDTSGATPIATESATPPATPAATTPAATTPASGTTTTSSPAPGASQ